MRDRESILTAYAVRAEGFREIAIKRARYLGVPLEEQQPVRSEKILAHSPSAPELDEGRPSSVRELQVLALLSRGLSNSEIGECLFITEETVKSHVKKIFACLGAKNRAHAVGLAFQAGVLGADEEDNGCCTELQAHQA